MEDYEYLALLEKHAGRKAVREIVDTIAPNWWDFSRNAKQFLTARKKTGSAYPVTIMKKTTTSIITIFTILSHVQAVAASTSFVESGDAWRMTEPLKGIMAHAAACGDIDGDDDPDLYVGNFCDRPPEAYLGRSGPVPNLLLINEGSRFREADQSDVRFKARTSGAVFVDFDNDGDLDLYVSNNSKTKGRRVPNKLFENIGGRFREISGDNDACVIMGGRSIGVLDYDGDGLLDLLVAEDKWTGRRTRLLRNLGHLCFDDVSKRVGLPEKLPGLGVITPDLNEDGRPDIFVAQANRPFLSQSDATYRPFDSDVFQYEPINREASACSVAFGDLNVDGLMDIVIVDHSQPARQHLYLNMGLEDGVPQFKDVTAEAGLNYRFPSWTPDKLHLKHGHVEIADFDNDGLPDILVAATYRDADASRPFVCRNLSRTSRPRIVSPSPATLGPACRELTGIVIPTFHVPPVAKADAYFAVGPVGDYDNDGRLDIFLANWFPQKPSKLYLNRSKSNHWLRVRVVGRTVNRMGIGAKVKVYPAGEIGLPEKLLGSVEIGTGFGFCSGQEAVAHFGLGDQTSCDLEIALPHGRGVIRRRNVSVDQFLAVHEPKVSN